MVLLETMTGVPPTPEQDISATWKRRELVDKKSAKNVA